jgi:hypothetical protein
MSMITMTCGTSSPSRALSLLIKDVRPKGKSTTAPSARSPATLRRPVPLVLKGVVAVTAKRAGLTDPGEDAGKGATTKGDLRQSRSQP